MAERLPALLFGGACGPPHGRPLPEGEAACEAFREVITVGLEAA